MSEYDHLRCEASVSERGYALHPWRCGRTAKGKRIMSERGERVELPACGIHLRAKFAPAAWTGRSR